MDHDRLRKIVEALLNDSGRTEQEADAARRKAAQLMMEAGVSEEDLLANDAELLKEKLEAGRREWLMAQYTMTAVARLSGCRCYFSKIWTKTGGRTDRKHVHYAGYKPDVENAQWLHLHIMEQGRRALSASGITDRRQKDDFLCAFGARMARRMNELSDTMDVVREEQGVADGHSLVVSKTTAIDDYMKNVLKLDLESSNGKGRSYGSADAIDAGRDAASKVSLGRPVSGKDAVLAIGSS